MFKRECLQHQNGPYPIGAYHRIISDALTEVLNFVQAPEPMTSLSFLSVMSSVVQRVADVRMPTGSVRPVSIAALILAESGERKTTIDDLLSKPLRDRDVVAERRFVRERLESELSLENWKMVRSVLIRKMAKLTEKGESTKTIERKIAEHDASKPPAPRLRLLIRQDLTYAALMSALEGDGESIFLSASEGDAALKSDLVQQHFAALSMAWGGEPILTDRASERRAAINPRCTLSVMVQYEVLKAFMAKRGDALRGSGFLARCLVAKPVSTIGTRRFWGEPPQWTYLNAFHDRLRELLNEGDLLAVADVPRRIVEFDDDARYQWVHYANRVEGMMWENGYLCEVRDFGAKLMEHVARVAAILHVFSCQSDRITVDTLERAYSIVCWHAEEFRLMFSPTLEVPQAIVDAHKIERYLRQTVWMGGFTLILRNLLHRFGPVRGLGRFVPAIDVLMAKGAINVTQAHRKAPLVINLNPEYFATPLA